MKNLSKKLLKSITMVCAITILTTQATLPAIPGANQITEFAKRIMNLTHPYQLEILDVSSGRNFKIVKEFLDAHPDSYKSSMEINPEDGTIRFSINAKTTDDIWSLEKELTDKTKNKYDIEGLHIKIEKFDKKNKHVDLAVSSKKGFEELLDFLEVHPEYEYLKINLTGAIKKIPSKFFTTLGENFAKYKITKLDLSGNDLDNIKGIENLINLTSLDLSNNKIKDLKALEIHKTTLKELNLAGNKIKNLKHIKKLENLIKLDISDNKIKSGKDLEKLTMLESLNVSNNELKNIYGIDQLENLVELNLANNELETTEGLENLRKLKVLDLSHNKLGANFFLYGPRIILLKNLKALHLGDNEIDKEDLERRFIPEDKIDELSATITNIEQLPESIEKLIKDRKIKVSFNDATKNTINNEYKQNRKTIPTSKDEIIIQDKQFKTIHVGR